MKCSCYKCKVTVHTRKILDEKLVVCLDCASRLCPNCGKNIKYSSIGSFRLMLINNSECKDCTSLNAFNKLNADIKNGIKDNGFKNKKHSEKTKKKMSDSSDKTWAQLNPYREKMSILSSGKKNGMFGKNFYDVWLEKYGKEQADILFKEVQLKKSLKMSGSNNPMFGKPSPVGSGNGMSGWYNGWFFRSLHELNYVIKILERFKIQWINGETIKIPYKDFNGIDRNYLPDFFISGKFLLECKPKRLWNTQINIVKKIAAQEYCKKHNLKYKMVDVGRISKQELEQLINSKSIILTKKYNGIKFK